MNIWEPEQKDMIDAHVHIMPGRLEGTEDKRFGVKMGKYGCKILPNGFGAPFLPNFMEKSEFSTEALIHVLDSYGIQRAVIMQSLCFKINEDVAEAVQSYPDRLRGAMAIEPKDEGVLDEIRYWYDEGLSVIKFEMSWPFGYTHPNAYPDLDFDSDLMNKVYALAGDLGLTMTIDTSPIGSKGYQPEALARAAEKNPGTKFVICHLGFPGIGLRDDPERYARWRQMISLAKYDNVWFDIAALPSVFRDEEYPYTEAAGFLREFIERYGPKAIWGSDIPGTYVDATYREMVRMYTRSGVLSDEERKQIFTSNAETVYFAQ